MEQERFSSLDRGLPRECVAGGIVYSGTTTGDAFRKTLRAGRLQKLWRLGLADEVAPSQSRLAGDLESVLCRMGERVDIIQTLHRAMAGENLSRSDALRHLRSLGTEPTPIGRPRRRPWLLG